MNRLDTTILVNISQYCGLRDLETLMRTNREWSHIITNDMRIIKRRSRYLHLLQKLVHGNSPWNDMLLTHRPVFFFPDHSIRFDSELQPLKVSPQSILNNISFNHK